MSIISKISDVLKEVFWLKPSPKKRVGKKATAKRRTVVKKKIVKAKKAVAVKPKAVVKQPIIKAKAPVKAPKVKQPLIDPNLVVVGEITHYFDRIKVAVVKINSGSILIGDKLTIIGAKTKFLQKVWSMQVESNDVKVAKKGQSVGLKVDKLVAIGDKVYK